MKEEKRLKAIRESNILATDVDFNYILETLATICDVPLCNIVIADKDEVYVIAYTGVELSKAHIRAGSCTNYTLQKNEYAEIEDIKQVEEIADKTYLVEDFDIRFYAGCPLTDSQGNIWGALNVYDRRPRNLTSLQRYFINEGAERIIKLSMQVRESQRLHHFDSMFNKSKDIIGIIRYSGEIVKVNPAFYELFEWNEEDVLNKNIQEISHPDYPIEQLDLKNRLSKGETEINFTIPTITKNKAMKWVEWTSTAEASTQLIYFIGRDITEIEEKSIQLKKSEARFRNFFENSQSLMCMHDLEGTLTAVNKAGAAIFGLPIEKFIEKNLGSFFPKERRELFALYLKELKQKGKAEGNTEIYRKDGSKRVWMYNSIVEKNSEGEAYVFANGVDLTERYLIEEELKIVSKNAEDATRAKSEFIANMSHEIRTPLNGIIGFTDLVLMTPLDETQQQYLKIINQSGTTLLSLVDQILDFSKIESRRLTLNEEKVDLQNLASDACAMVTYESEKKGLELLLDFQRDLPRFIWADEIRLKQVLVNLLGNAVKFTEKGEVKLTIALKEEMPDGDVILNFKVTDTGIGIHPDMKDQIFRAFTQEDGSITKKYGGTGLGLTISNRLLELKDSKLKLKSELGKGSCFCFDLKLKAERDVFDDELLKGIKKMLVVDDNDSNRQILKRMLELKNIEVDEADSGLSALLMLQKNAEYDVIIMDYHMPVMDGIETIRKIKDITRSSLDQPIVMLYSSSDDDKLQSACDELEIESRLVKPIKMQEMYHVLARLKNEDLQKKERDATSDLKKEELKDEKCDKGYKILIVEDNEINRYLTKILVEQLCPKCTIFEAIDGVQAVKMFVDKLPDLVLMDIQMPNMNGIDATKEIRSNESGKSVPIIALTAGNMTGEKERCLAAGMNDFMVKPLIKKDLSDMFRKWLKSNDKSESEKHSETTQVEHLNESWFQQYSSDDPEFKENLIQLAKSNMQESVEVIQKALVEEDLKTINAAGHKLKGTTLAVGLTEMSKIAVAFELLENFDEHYVDELMKSLLIEINIVNELLNNE